MLVLLNMCSLIPKTPTKNNMVLITLIMPTSFLKLMSINKLIMVLLIKMPLLLKSYLLIQWEVTVMPQVMPQEMPQVMSQVKPQVKPQVMLQEMPQVDLKVMEMVL